MTDHANTSHECPQCGTILSFWAWPEDTYAAWCQECEMVWRYTGPLSAPTPMEGAKHAPVDGLLP